MTEAILVGGPQDGGRIKGVGGPLPLVVYLGPKWLGDGYSAWSREPNGRFPARYVYGRGQGDYQFDGYQTERPK